MARELYYEAQLTTGGYFEGKTVDKLRKKIVDYYADRYVNNPDENAPQVMEVNEVNYETSLDVQQLKKFNKDLEHEFYAACKDLDNEAQYFKDTSSMFGRL